MEEEGARASGPTGRGGRAASRFPAPGKSGRVAPGQEVPPILHLDLIRRRRDVHTSFFFSSFVSCKTLLAARSLPQRARPCRSGQPAGLAGPAGGGGIPAASWSPRGRRQQRAHALAAGCGTNGTFARTSRRARRKPPATVSRPRARGRECPSPRRAPGTWHLAPCILHLAPGTRHLALGTWRLAHRTWHLTCHPALSARSPRPSS